MKNRFFSIILTLHVSIFYRNALNRFIVKCQSQTPQELNIVDYKVDSIPLHYIEGTGYAIEAEVGTQQVKLLLSSNTCGLMLFENTNKICFGDRDHACYNPHKSKSATWCKSEMLCIPGKFNYECNEVASPDYLKDVSITPVRINSYDFKIFSIEGYENLKIAMDYKKSGYTFEKVPVKLARSLDRYDHKIFKNVHGLMGIAGQDMCCRSSIWEKISNDYRGFFVIDINPPANVRFPSKLYLGMDRMAEEDIVWSERRQLGGIFTNSFLQFTMYDLKMCDVNLFGKSSSNWEAIIDLTTPYLVLPRNFWITLMTYLPVDESCFTDDSQPRLCKMINVERYFPIIEFKMSQSYYLNYVKVEPPTIKIPLENLLEGEGKNKTILIIPDESRDKSPYTLNPSIKLGYKVLESLNVVVDTEGYRIGLSIKNQLVGSTSKCADVPVCIGDQLYEPALNVCVNPLCSIWLMKRLNPEKGICETSIFAKVLFTTIVSALVIAEFYCNFARKHILKITSRLCQ